MQTADCIQWWGAFNAKGYGIRRRRGDRKVVGAHRLVWEECFGPIPDGLCVLHSCDNPPCVNPEHLFLGTKGENNRDAAKKRRSRTRMRLTLDQVRAIRSSAATQTALGLRYGITQSSISSIKLGKTYRWDL